MTDEKLARPITLLGGISIIVGAVIGIGIFVLVAPIAVQTGSGIWLAVTLAIMVSLIGVVPLIQIASALPRAGGGYIYGSRLLSPVLGVLASFWAVLGGAASTSVVAWGMAGYTAPILPGEVPLRLVATAWPLGFYLLYLFGLKLAMWIQIVMAGHLIVGLLLYVGYGVAQVPLDFAIELPHGISGFLVGCILCYSVCMGFQVVAELGEEMQHAQRNIPLSLLIGGAVVWLVYAATTLLFVQTVPLDEASLTAMTRPLVDSASQFMPSVLITFMWLGGVSAGLTSFNAGAIALPREIFAMARDRVLPGALAHLGANTHAPLRAVSVYFVLVFFLTFFGQEIAAFLRVASVLDLYGVMAGTGILMLTIILSVAALRLPRVMPDRYASAYFRLPKPWLYGAVTLSIVSAGGFILVVVREVPSVIAVYAGYSILILLYYLLRVRWLRSQGVNWEALQRRIPGFDEGE